MHEGRPFSISNWGAQQRQDDSITPEALADAGFTTEDGAVFLKGEMSYSSACHSVSYKGKLILDKIHSLAQLTALYIQITSQH